MAAWREVSTGVYGAWRLARLDRSAMALFDRSIEGVWRSFLAAAVCYPGFLILVTLRLEPEQLAQSSLFHIWLVETIGYVVAWCAFPLLIFRFCRWLGREAQSFDFIIAYNWSQILQTALLLVVTGLTAVAPMSPDTAAIIELAAYLAILLYEWFIARVALDTGGLAATTVVLIDIVLGSVLVRITTALY